MKFRATLFVAISFVSATMAHAAPGLYRIYGNVPGEYVGKPKQTYARAVLTIQNKIIVAIEERAAPPAGVIEMRRPNTPDYDVIYPGLFNLHNHTKQNVLGVWKDARGQFQNRFEWRGWGAYKDAVSGNMNPWISFGTPITCASFRYSELQAMALGTTYLQGPSSCVSNFAINRVEDKDAFVNYNNLPAVQAPTDLIYPSEMTFVWKYLRPIMLEGARTDNFDVLLEKVAQEPRSPAFSYEAALKRMIQQHCPNLVARNPVLSAADPTVAVGSSDAIKILSSARNLDEGCVNMPDGMRRYVYFIHPTIAGKKRLIQGRMAGLIAHLAEGRRNDPYNKLEFKLLRLLGLDGRNVNIVHGVGVDEAGFAFMAKRGMGLIWSPFSNHLLYNETADIAAAMRASNGQLLIALGSDWTPTGSRGTLEEVKMARKYLQAERIENIFADENGNRIPMDEALYRMMTSNPARMLGHAGEAGTIAPRAAASLIVVTKINENPYTNLVLNADENQVNLVIVDGKPVYGNLSYIEKTEAAGITPRPTQGYEDLGVYFDQLNRLDPRSVRVDERMMNLLLGESSSEEDDQDHEDETAPRSSATRSATPAQKLQYLTDVASSIINRGAIQPYPLPGSQCRFSGGERKVFVPVDSKAKNNLVEFYQRTGMDLDRVGNIMILLQGGLMTHSRNKWSSPTSNAFRSSAQYLSPVYSCQDRNYLERIGGNGWDATRLFERYVGQEIMEERRNRPALRRMGGSEVPRRFAENYGLPYAEL